MEVNKRTKASKNMLYSLKKHLNIFKDAKEATFIKNYHRL